RGAQSGIGGGGRYDGLSEDIGGPALPGIGFAVGLDRIVLAVESERAGAVRPTAAAGLAFGARGLKGAMKAADRSGADYALLIGADERSTGSVRIKDLRSGDQQDVAATAA